MPVTKQRETLVFIHGWGNVAETLDPLIELLSEQYYCLKISLPGFASAESGGSAFSESETVSDLAWTTPLSGDWCTSFLAVHSDQLPEKFYFVGWSLGSLIAGSIARRIPGRVLGLISLAMGPSFLERENWRDAMKREVFDAFQGDFRRKPEKVRKKFLLMQQMGDAHFAQIKSLTKNIPRAEIAIEQWVDGLNCLENIDLLDFYRSAEVPILSLLGDQDTLVPASLVKNMYQFPSTSVQVIRGGGHSFFLSRAAAVAKDIAFFIEHGGRTRAKDAMAKSFSRAAEHYSNFARVQKEIGAKHLDRISEIPRDAHVLDIGCGDGDWTLTLLRKFPSIRVTGLDIAEGMLRHASKTIDDPHQLLLADAESLPISEATYDVVVSNLAVQWSEKPELFFTELYRVLKPGGRAYVCTLGQHTLEELRYAWEKVDDAVHVNNFYTQEALVRVIAKSQLALQSVQSATFLDCYADTMSLMKSVKNIGASNMNYGRRKSLLSKGVYRALDQALGEVCGAGDSASAKGLCLTYQALFIELHK